MIKKTARSKTHGDKLERGAAEKEALASALKLWRGTALVARRDTKEETTNEGVLKTIKKVVKGAKKIVKGEVENWKRTDG